MIRLTRVVVAATALLLFSGVGVAVQSQPIDWKNADEVGPADREAIVRLARRLGVQQARQITFTQYLPTLCPFVLVESVATVEGKRRRWLELRLRRQDWRACTKVPLFSTRGEGKWRGSRAELSTEEEWRFADGDWTVDVRLGTAVRYEDAERIVLAIRRKTLVNRLPRNIGPLKLDPTMPDIDADEIRSIDALRSMAGAYEVRTGRGATGEVFEVRVRDGAVELHSQATWMVRRDFFGTEARCTA